MHGSIVKRIAMGARAVLHRGMRVWHILPREDRRAWIGVLSLGFLAAGVEALTALAVLMLASRLSGSTAATREFKILDHLNTWVAPNLDPTSFAGISLIAVMTAGILLSSLHVYWETRLTSNAYAWAGIRLLSNTLHSGYSWFHQQNSAAFTRNIQESAGMFATGLLQPLSRAVREAMMSAAICALAIVVRPELAPFGLFFAAIYFLIHWLPSRLSTRLGRASESNKQQQQQALNEAFELFDEIRIAGLTDAYVERFGRPRRAFRNLLTFRRMNEMLPPRFAEWTVIVCLVGAIIVLKASTGEGALHDYWLQTFVFGLYLAYRLRSTFSGFLSSLVAARFGWPSFINVEAGLRVPVGFQKDNRGSLAFANSLRLVDVSFVHPGSESGIRNINLDITRGAWIGIAGRTGAGKSTLAAVIMGLVRPQSGTILLDGCQVDLDMPAWYRKVGFVSQRIALIDGSLQDNITLQTGGPVDKERLKRAIKLAQLDNVIAQHPGGLGGRVGERGSLLSGGQRQRVAVARALYRNAELLVLDEATSALDYDTEAEILSALQKLRGSFTLLTISHRQSALELCDEVVFLAAGRRIAPAELAASNA